MEICELVTVYPRWRGEHRLPGISQERESGLSPLARGTPSTNTKTALISRFIPAGAGNTLILVCLFPLMMVYPRWRGEHASLFGLCYADFGLSPLARGTQQSKPIANSSKRFIPAGAGNTLQTVKRKHKFAVYPRWRGEHFRELNVVKAHLGLSPLARGTQGRTPLRPRPQRFIPAGAGNTFRCCLIFLNASVCPRWRGEHSSAVRGFIPRYGLSPLARGTHCGSFTALTFPRFIPAGAGNTR